MPHDLPFTLGADPEFALRMKGAHVNASDVFTHHGGYLGTDVPTTGEVRPGIASSPDELVARLYTCFKKGSTDLSKDLSFHAGHFFDGMPLGGHLHCGGIDPRNQQPDKNAALLFAIEFYVMYCLSDLIDDVDTRNKRRTLTAYGKLSHIGKRFDPNGHNAVEYKSYGGYEYRSPGSWLVSPPVAYANITLFALANLLFLKHKSKVYEVLPDPLIMSPEDKVQAIANIHNLVDIPECCADGFEFTNLLVENRESIDWMTNFRNEWKF